MASTPTTRTYDQVHICEIPDCTEAAKLTVLGPTHVVVCDISDDPSWEGVIDGFGGWSFREGPIQRDIHVCRAHEVAGREVLGVIHDREVLGLVHDDERGSDHHAHTTCDIPSPAAWRERFDEGSQSHRCAHGWDELWECTTCDIPSPAARCAHGWDGLWEWAEWGDEYCVPPEGLDRFTVEEGLRFDHDPLIPFTV